MVRFKLALLVLGGALFSLSCSLSLNVNGPGDNPTPTDIQESVNRAVQRTLTALAQENENNSGTEQITPNATAIAASVNTLVAQALLTQQPTEAPFTPTTARPARTPVPPTAVIIIQVAPTEIPPPTFTPLPTDTPEPTSTPIPTDTPTFTPTLTPTPTNTYTPTRIPTHCPQEYCVIMQRCEPGENTRAVGTIYENDRPKNGVRVRVSYAMGGPPVIPDFVSGNNPYSPNAPDPQHPGYYQLGLLEGGALAGNWWVFVVNDDGDVLSEGRLFNTQGERTASSCQVGVTDFYR